MMASRATRGVVAGLALWLGACGAGSSAPDSAAPDLSLADLAVGPSDGAPGDQARPHDLNAGDLLGAADLRSPADMAPPDLSPADASAPDLLGDDLAAPDDAAADDGGAGEDAAGPPDLALRWPAFQPAARIDVGDGYGNLVVGDFDGDGDFDLALCNGGGGKLQTLLGKGDGTFTLVADSAPLCHDHMTAALIDGDARWDLVVGADSGAEVLIANGDGTFSDAASLTTAESNLVGAHTVADYNGDGLVDVVTLRDQGGLAPCLAFFAGNGDGTFQAGVDAEVVNLADPAYANGLIDCGNAPGGLFCRGEGNISGDREIDERSNGDGTFKRSFPNGLGQDVSPLRPIDANLDGKPEAVGWINGQIDNPDPMNPGAMSTGLAFVQVGDFDGDGKVDEVVSDQWLVWFNLTSGGGWNGYAPYQPRIPSSEAIADFNHDGKADLAVVGSTWDPVHMTFTDPGVDILLGK